MTWLSLLLWPLVALISVGCFTAVALRVCELANEGKLPKVNGETKVIALFALLVVSVAGLWLNSQRVDSRDMNRCMDLRGNWSSGGCDLRWSQGK